MRLFLIQIFKVLYWISSETIIVTSFSKQFVLKAVEKKFDFLSFTNYFYLYFTKIMDNTWIIDKLKGLRLKCQQYRNSEMTVCSSSTGSSAKSIHKYYLVFDHNMNDNINYDYNAYNDRF